MSKNLLNLLAIVLFTAHYSISIAAEYATYDDDPNQKAELEFIKAETKAKEFLGKTFWYVPRATANYRIVFFSSLPNRQTFVQESYLNDGNGRPVRGQFKPLEKTTFQVIGVHQNSIYSISRDKFSYEIQFPDGKKGFIHGKIGFGGTPFDGFEGHIYDDYLDPKGEYIFTEDSEVVLAREIEKEKLAEKEKESVLKQEIEAGKAREAAQMAEDKKVKKAASVAKAKRKAKGGVTIGMTKSQVLASNWGKPNDINSTVTSNGTQEQWVFDGGYLYFTNGELTAIQN